MKMFAIRIPEEMKRQMSRIKINWAEFLRGSITEALQSDKKRSMILKFRHLTEHSKPTGAGTAAGILRQMRDRG
ncbi:MAG: hypothetical protein A2901_06925 [Elusimicrobia bacterium RIFCSPLOWO2_01_FULL_54_10]|nr:MAG: hypothetical protein A2901_06925 [Elusimicrobia bacterium RIFCSPLOWO2_01_FULL_54_10]